MANGIENPERRDLLSKGAKVVVALAASSVLNACAPFSNILFQRNFRSRIEDFSWKDTKDPKKLKDFISLLADRYLNDSPSTKLSHEDLTSPDKLLPLPNGYEYAKKIRELGDSTHTPTPTEFAYYIYAVDKVLINMGSLEFMYTLTNNEAGVVLLSSLGHEWGHQDRKKRTTGEWINNPGFDISSGSEGKASFYKSYLGGAVLSVDGVWASGRFEEVWNETNNRRRIAEKIGIKEIPSSGYAGNGTDFLIPFQKALGIPLELSKSMHQSSDREGFAKLISDGLPKDLQMLPSNIALSIFAAIDAGNSDNLQPYLKFIKPWIEK